MSNVPLQNTLDKFLDEHPKLDVIKSQHEHTPDDSKSPRPTNPLHSCSPMFLSFYIPIWQKHGFLSRSESGIALENDPPEVGRFLPLNILGMAQKTRYRLILIIHYLQFQVLVRRVREAPESRAIANRRAESLVISQVMADMYEDWTRVDTRKRSERRRRYLREHRQARRWLVISSKLSFGALLLCSKQIESQVNDAHSTDDSLAQFAREIACQYPKIINGFRLLDGTVRRILNQNKDIRVPDTNMVVAEIESLLHDQNLSCNPEGSSSIREAIEHNDLPSIE